MATSYKKAYEGNVEALSVWGPIDRSILDGGRRTPPPLPSALFGSAWSELVKLSEDKGAPADYVALSYLVVCASMIGSKRRVVPYRGSSWEEPSILWLGLVGDPSHNKSPSLDPFMSILRTLEGEKREDHLRNVIDYAAESERAKVEKAAWQEAVKMAAKDGLQTPPIPKGAIEPDEPVRHRYYMQDATTEAAQSILSKNPNGCLMLRDELAGWFTSFDRYNPGGRPYWIVSFGGRSYTVDRKGTPEPMHIPYNGVPVIGGIQPAKLAECVMKGADDGLAARFLFIWPERREFSRPSSNADLSSFEAAIRRLDDLDWQYDADGKAEPFKVMLDSNAADLFDNCQRFYREREGDASGLLKSFVGKLAGLTLRLAMAAEFSRWAWEGGKVPTIIGAQTLEHVADFVGDYVLPMAERVYGDAALPPVERNAATLARYITRYRLKSINARDLKREARLPGLREAAEIDPAIDALIEANWLRPSPSRQGGTVGRARADYAVNPVVIGE